MKQHTRYLLITIVFVIGAYLLTDLFGEGLFREFIAEQFFYMEEYSDSAGILHQYMTPDWLKIKQLLVLSTLFVVCACVLFVSIQVQRKQKKFEKNMKHVMESALERFRDGTDPLLPDGYQGIEALLLQIRVKEEKQLQLLEKQTQQKHDLISYLAHDMKTPLTSVIGYLHLLHDVNDIPAPQKEKYIRITLEKAERLEQLIDEFFDITRFNLHDIVISRGRIQMDFLFEQLREQFYPQLLAQQKTLRLCIKEGITYYGDADKLARAFNNILKNAISYSYPHTEIIIQITQSETELLLSFHNQGDEIPQQKLAMIFEKFYRLDKARSTHTGGAGLGLAIAKEIVEAHGGSIDAQSSMQETVFHVHLPLQDVDHTDSISATELTTAAME